MKMFVVSAVFILLAPMNALGSGVSVSEALRGRRIDTSSCRARVASVVFHPGELTYDHVVTNVGFVTDFTERWGINISLWDFLKRSSDYRQQLEKFYSTLSRYTRADDGFARIDRLLPLAFEHAPTAKRWARLRQHNWRVGTLRPEHNPELFQNDNFPGAWTDSRKRVIRFRAVMPTENYIDPNVILVHEVADAEFFAWFLNADSTNFSDAYLALCEQINQRHPKIFEGLESESPETSERALQVSVFLRERRSYNEQWDLYQQMVRTHPEIVSPTHEMPGAQFNSSEAEFRETTLSLFEHVYLIPRWIMLELWDYQLPPDLID